jgi:hypothetical protein
MRVHGDKRTGGNGGLINPPNGCDTRICGADALTGKKYFDTEATVFLYDLC